MADLNGNKTGGRQAGTPNSDTKKIREKFAFLVENNLDKLQADLDLMKPVDRVAAIQKFAQFCLPTLKAVEYEDKNPGVEGRRFVIGFIEKTE